MDHDEDDAMAIMRNIISIESNHSPQEFIECVPSANIKERQNSIDMLNNVLSLFRYRKAVTLTAHHRN